MIYLWLAFPLLCGFISSSKDDSFFVAFILGLILGPLGLIIVIFTSGVRCPFCRKRINLNATICPFCQEKLRE